MTVMFASRMCGRPLPAERRDAIASASSKNSTAFCSVAARNAATMFFGVSPTHIDSTSA